MLSGMIAQATAAVTFLLLTLSSSVAQTATIRVATQQVEAAAESYYAKDTGIFARAGLDADIQALQNTPAIIAAITSSAADIGYSTVDTLANIHQKNISLIVIAPAAEYVSPATAHISALVLAANSQVHQARDLSGKTIAVAGLHTLSEIGARAWIDRNGGDSSAVKFVEVPFPALPAALEIGRVDAAWVPEPFIGVATKYGRVLAFGFDSVSKHFLMGAWFTTPQWAKDHPDLVKRFAAAIHDAAVWANKNQAVSGDILTKYTKIDPSVVATMVRAHYAERLTPALMQPLIDVSARYNNFNAFPAQELIYDAR